MATMANGIPTMAALAALIAACAAAAPANAQPYPNRPITLVIPLPPGGTTDMMARAVADKLGAALGQQIVIENRAVGGRGAVRTHQASEAPRDRCTLQAGL